MTGLRQNHSLDRLLRATGLPRSVYYYWAKETEESSYAAEKQAIAKIFHEHKGRYGYRRVTLALKAQGQPLNHKTVQKLMGQLNLKSLVRPKRYQSYKGQVGRVADHLLCRNFKASQPHEKWVTDVTEFNIRGEKVYLSPILDLYNQEIVSYAVDTRPNYSMVLQMLDMAIGRLSPEQRPMVHSDQGWQYQMPNFRQKLKDWGLPQSMSRKGNCLDNAVMENFFGVLKSEFFYTQKFESVASFIAGLKEYIHYYNHDRIKQKLKGLSPVNYRTQASLAPA